MAFDREGRLQRELNQVKCQRDNMENALQAAHKEARASKEEYEKLRANMRNMQQEIHDLESREARLAKDANQRAELAERLKGQLEALRLGQAPLEDAARKSAAALHEKTAALSAALGTSGELKRQHQKASEDLAAAMKGAGEACAAEAEAQRSLAACQATAALLRNECKSFRSAAAAAREEAARELAQSMAATAEAAHLRADLEEAKEALARAQLHVARAGQADEYQKALKEERAANAASAEHTARLEAALAAARSGVAERDDVIVKMGAQMDARSERLTAMTAAKAAAEARAGELERALAALEAKRMPQVEDLGAALDAMRAELEDERERATKLEEANVSLSTRLANAVSTVEAARTEQRATEAALVTSESEIQGLTAALQVREGALLSIQNKMAAQQSDTMQACADLDGAKAKFAVEQAKLQEEVDILRIKLDASEERANELQAFASGADSKAVAGEELVESLQARLAAAQAETAPVRAKLSSLIELLDAKDEKIDELSAAYKAAEAQRAAAVEVAEGHGGDGRQAAALDGALASLAAARADAAMMTRELAAAVEAKEAAVAAASEMRLMLAEARADAEDKLAAAQQMSEAIKAECSSAVGFSVGLERKLASARQETEAERRLALQLRAELSAAQDRAIAAEEKAVELEHAAAEAHAAAEEALCAGGGSFKRARRQFEDKYTEKIAALQGQVAANQEALEAEAEAAAVAEEQLEVLSAQLQGLGVTPAVEVPASPSRSPSPVRYSLRSRTTKAQPDVAFPDLASPAHKVPMGASSPSPSPAPRFEMVVDTRQ